MQTPLINIMDLQKLVGLSVNVPEDKINPHILSAQNWQLKDIMGKDCMVALQDRYASNTLSTEDEGLLVYVTPFLVYHAYSKYIRASTMISTGSGIIQMTGDNMGQATSGEKNLMAQEYENNAEAYTGYIADYLEENKAYYTCYDEDESRQNAATYFI